MKELRVVEDATAVAGTASRFVADYVGRKPDARVLVATGNTPIPTYDALARLNPDMSQTWAVQLDEYLIPKNDPRSLYDWMARAYVKPLGIQNVLRFDLGLDPQEMCEVHANAIKDLGGIDLAILGLGPNGHLGFNEPPSAADAPTRVVDLTDASLASNAGYWEGQEVPRRAVTVGMNAILGAETTLLIVTGEHKRDILRRTLYEPVSPELPSSYLRNTNLTLITDQDVSETGA